MSSHIELPTVVAGYIGAVNTRDWDALATHFTDEAEFWMLGTRAACGPTTIAHRLQEAITAFPETRAEVTRATVGGTVVAVEMLLSGRTTAGETFERNEADVIELTRDGTAITRIAAWSAPAHTRSRPESFGGGGS